MDNNMQSGPTYIFLNSCDIEAKYQPIQEQKLETENKNLIDVINSLILKINELENKNM